VAVEIVSAFAVPTAAARASDAEALVFEYMATSLEEMTGHPAPVSVDGLPDVLRSECRNLPHAYRDPGILLIAYVGGRPAGCVGLIPRAKDTAEVKRLYVRHGYRGAGVARKLMTSAHDHAKRHGITRLLLDVLPSRAHVVAFYRRLGYEETEPFTTQAPAPMIFMRLRTIPGTGSGHAG
jgi:GNAT superfamily N-acetyltransferase